GSRCGGTGPGTTRRCERSVTTPERAPADTNPCASTWIPAWCCTIGPTGKPVSCWRHGVGSTVVSGWLHVVHGAPVAFSGRHCNLADDCFSPGLCVASLPP